MAGYRRFIAYVYEYLKEKKGNNCGFIKVEVRDKRCTLEVHLQCPGIPAQTECRVYGFVRNGGLMDGNLLDTCRAEEGTIECLIETDALNMSDTGTALGRMGGFILTTESGAFFGTEWDDIPIRPENFREVNRKSQDAAGIATLYDNGKREKERGDERNRERMEEGDKDAAQEKKVLDNEQAGGKAGTAMNNPELEREIPERETPEGKMPEGETSERRTPEREMPERRRTDSVTQESIIREPKTTEAEISGAEMQAAAEPKRSDRNTSKPSFGGWDEKGEIFEDGDFTECRRIQLKDLARLNRRDAGLRNNRFLQYGCYNFGHLLICRKADGQYILGVPGGYDQQEHFMANMFGFPYFKESRHIQLPKGRGGYWYRLINTPNFH